MANTTYSRSQTATYTATGTLDQDVSPIITNISPDDNPFLSRFKTEADAKALSFDWFVDELHPPTQNAKVERRDFAGKDVGGLGRKMNTIQRMEVSAIVTDDMQKHAKLYTPSDEMARQMTLKMKELARDMEFAIVKNDTSRMDMGSVPALTGGIPYFMQEDTMDITFDYTSTTDTVTVTSGDPHGLDTGSFIMFKPKTSADVLPAGLTEGTRYYVALSSTNPLTAFSLYKSLEDAVAGTNQITLTDNGTGTCQLLLNNIINCNNSAFTRNDIDAAMELLFYRGGHATDMFMSGHNKVRFTQAMNLVNTVHRPQQEQVVINNATAYEGDFGKVTVNAHRFYPDNVIDILDMSMWAIKYFERPKTEELPRHGTYTEKVIHTAFGLKGTQPLASARLINVG